MRRRVVRIVSSAAHRVRRAHIALNPRPHTSDARPGTWRCRIEDLLTDNVVPFWRARATAGPDGYPELFDGAGQLVRTKSRHVRTQARTLWVLSRLMQTPYGWRESTGAAARGFEFLSQRFWDPVHGGVHSRLSPANGDSGKHLYDHLMALDAAIEFRRATQTREAERLASDLLETIDTRFRDGNDGYTEGFATDWGPLPHGAGLLAEDGSHKTVPSHINALQVLTNAHEAGLADLTTNLLTLIDIIDQRAVLPGAHMMGERFSRDWSTVVGRPTVSFGHDLERVWMAPRAREATGAPTANYGVVFDETVRWGWDRRHGGFYFSGEALKPATLLHKQWWVQAEALVACLTVENARLTEPDRVFEDTLRWIEGHQADWAGGEWHDTIDVIGRARGNKGWTWKTGYHTTRSLLLSLGLIGQRGAVIRGHTP